MTKNINLSLVKVPNGDTRIDRFLDELPDDTRRRTGAAIAAACNVADAAIHGAGDFTRKLGLKLDTLSQTQSPTGRIIKGTLEAARSVDAINDVSPDLLPRLSDDPQKHRDLARKYRAQLETMLSLESPMNEQYRLVIVNALQEEIPPEALATFLESEILLKKMIRHIRDLNYLSPDANSFVDKTASVAKGGIKRARSAGERVEKVKFDPQTADIIRRCMTDFLDNYELDNPELNFATWVKAMKKHFPTINLTPWIEANMHLFVDTIRYKQQPDGKKTRLFKALVDRVYREKALSQPYYMEKFLNAHLPSFVTVSTDHPSGHPDSVTIDIDKLQKFYDNTLAAMTTDRIGLTSLRGKLIKAIKQHFQKEDGESIAHLALNRESKDFVEGYLIDEPGDIDKHLKRFLSSHNSFFSVKEFLVEPTEVPEQMKRDFEDIWPQAEDGTHVFDEDRYTRGLQNIFGMKRKIEADRVAESHRSVEARLRRTFRGTNQYLDDTYKFLGIDSEPMSERVRNSNDYNKLLYILCTTDDLAERLQARRKIELGFLSYSCEYSARHQHREYNAKAIKEYLEGSERGIYIDEQQPLEEFSFVEYPKGTVYTDKEGVRHELPKGGIILLDDRVNESDLPEGGIVTDRVKLIPGTIGGIKCSYLPAKSGQQIKVEDRSPDSMVDVYEPNPREYLGTKSLQAEVTKLLRGEKISSKDITDKQRLTMVFDNIEDLRNAQSHVQDYFFSTGTALKIENRYGELVNVSPTIRHGKDKNGEKSDDYKTFRYVGEIPVPSPLEGIEGPIHALVEIRLMLKEDLAKEKSLTHDASHTRYEVDRSITAIETIAPYETCPDHYKTLPPRKYDVQAKLRKPTRRLICDPKPQRDLRAAMPYMEAGKVVEISGYRRRKIKTSSEAPIKSNSIAQIG